MRTFGGASGVAIVAALLPQLAHAGATMKIDEERSITVAVGMRTAFTTIEDGAPDGEGPSSDPLVEGAILAVSGELSKKIRLQVNSGRGPAGELKLVDGILQLDGGDMARVWAGRLLPPSDRATFTGPFFGASWDPSFVAVYPAGFAGRDDGAVLWGQIAKRLKYHAGAFRGRDGGTNTHDDLMWAGRIAVDLWEPQPGYYTSGTFHGTRNVLAIGGGGRWQKNGAGVPADPIAMTPANPADFLGWNADLFVERRFGPVGTLTVDCSFYRYDLEGVTDPFLVEGDGFYASAAWLLPFEIRGAKFQPAFRYQALDAAEAGPRRTRWDGTLNLLLLGHGAKAALIVAGEDRGLGDGEILSVKIGAQLIL